MPLSDWSELMMTLATMRVQFIQMRSMRSLQLLLGNFSFFWGSSTTCLASIIYIFAIKKDIFAIHQQPNEEVALV